MLKVSTTQDKLSIIGGVISRFSVVNKERNEFNKQIGQYYRTFYFLWITRIYIIA